MKNKLPSCFHSLWLQRDSQRRPQIPMMTADPYSCMSYCVSGGGRRPNRSAAALWLILMLIPLSTLPFTGTNCGCVKASSYLLLVIGQWLIIRVGAVHGVNTQSNSDQHPAIHGPHLAKEMSWHNFSCTTHRQLQREKTSAATSIYQTLFNETLVNYPQ